MPGLWAQANVQGQWSTLSGSMPINPVHAALLHNGKILVVAGSGNCPPSMSGCPAGPPYGPANASGALLLDPATGTFTSFTLSWDMFCNGMLVLSDGRAFINGGSQAYDPFLGQPKSAVFDPSTNTFTDVENMAHGRWYPTVTTLGDGRVMTFSGRMRPALLTIQSRFIPWARDGARNTLRPFTPPLYPRMHLLPDGKVFYSGSGTTSMLFDPVAHTWTTMATTIYSGIRTYGTSVLLPLTPANSYDPRVMIMGGGSPATATTEIIDLAAANPVWQPGPSMSQGRIEMNAVLLPSGKVLALGGSTNDEDSSTASLNADLYDPVTDSFSSAGANAYPRLYHSVALLLPDATVWFAGGNPARGSYEQRMEIYRPAYLFNANGTAATRPAISSAPDTISWNGTFAVSTPDAASISSIVLVRPGAPTHAFDMEQRLVGLSFTTGSGTLSVTAPPNGNIAPPGYYMLFLVNSSGVPSVAKFVQLGASISAPAPTVSAITPNSGSANGGTSVNLTGTGFLAGAAVTLAWDGCNRRDRGKQHRDYGDHCGARDRRSQRRGHQYRWPERHLDQWLYLHQSAADRVFNRAQFRIHQRRYKCNHHRHRLPDGSNRKAWRDCGRQRGGSEQPFNYRDHGGARSRRMQRRGHQHGWPERHVDQRLHLHQPGADGVLDRA